MIILELIEGSLKSWIPILMQTKITINANKTLNCSPLNLDVNFDPYCAPITPPINRKIASIRSTDKLYVA